MLKNKTYKLFISTFFFVILLYVFDFYIFDNSTNLQFWCVEINNFQQQNIRIPIHCDEGPYQFASESVENFFDKVNPYQGRPLFVFALSLFRYVFSIFSFFNLSEYQIFRLSFVFMQILILICIVIEFAKLINLKFDKIIDYFLIFSLISIPSIRWNVFLSSVGNIPFLLFLLVLNNYLKVNSEIKQNKKLFVILGFFSLAHLSAILYGSIFLLLSIFKERKIFLYQTLVNFSYLVIFQIFYRTIIYFSNYEFYDWHRDVHNQFYWIIDSIKGEPTTNCQTLDTFLLCNTQITQSYIGYFAISVIFTLFLILILRLQNKKTPESIKSSFKINIFVFVFWSLQGIYEPFRFVNYSIGYFLFLSLIIFVVEFKYNPYLLFSVLIYSLSVPYLEPYNSALDTPQLNVLTIISVVFFFIFVRNEFASLKIENNKN
tara:strand:+ start:13679 stop:14971 length:1293 start_codon:yes stop_codon:yes gene_type:complete